MTRGLRTDCSVCQDTTISIAASAPNCKCSPATGGVVSRSGDGGAAGAPRAAPVPMRDAATTAPPAIPAAASSLRRLSSRLNAVSSVVMALRLLHNSRRSLVLFDDSLANYIRRVGHTGPPDQDKASVRQRVRGAAGD